MKRILLMLGCMLMLGSAVHADRFSLTFGDTSRPGTLKITGGGGDTTVEGYDGKEVIIESAEDGLFDDSEVNNERARGLRRLTGTGMHVTTDEESNVIKVNRAMNDPVALQIRVPRNTSIYIGGNYDGGNVRIRDVSGEIDVNTMEGDITLENISGSLSAHSMDGEIMANITRVNPKKQLSFSTMDGDIDVSLPADIKASVKFSTMDGDIYTDFDVQRDTEGAQREWKKQQQKVDALGKESKDSADEDPEYSTGIVVIPKPGPMPNVVMNLDNRMTFNMQFPGALSTTFYGTINGGGQYIQINTMDGDIYFRRKE